MNDEQAIQVLLELVNRAPKNMLELVAAQSAIEHLKTRLEELKPKPKED